MTRWTLGIVGIGSTIGADGAPPTQRVNSNATDHFVEGKRVQKFVYQGIGRVLKNQGTPWPRR